jgi:hypothetical protein
VTSATGTQTGRAGTSGSGVCGGGESAYRDPAQTVLEPTPGRPGIPASTRPAGVPRRGSGYRFACRWAYRLLGTAPPPSWNASKSPFPGRRWSIRRPRHRERQDDQPLADLARAAVGIAGRTREARLGLVAVRRTATEPETGPVERFSRPCGARRAHRWTGDWGSALADGNEAVARAEALGQPGPLARALVALGQDRCGPRSPRAGR